MSQRKKTRKNARLRIRRESDDWRYPRVAKSPCEEVVPRPNPWRLAAASSVAHSHGVMGTSSRERIRIHPVMTDEETLELRPNIIDGVRQDDDFEVIWRGLPIGRILKEPSSPHWWWGCNVYGQPPTPNDRGPAINFKDCQVRFRLAWARMRSTLTEQDIAIAARHAEGRAPQVQPAPDAQPQPREARQIMANARAAPRQRVLKSAIIEFDGGTISCVVRNISETGAALEVDSPLGIPAEFNLLVSGDRAQLRCHVVWRKEKRIGVRFASS